MVAVGTKSGQVRNGEEHVNEIIQEIVCQTAVMEVGTMSYFANCHRPQLSVYEVDAGLVHSLHRWRYAYREGLTTVMVRHLATGARLAIRCSSFVKKVSVFGDRLAVQLGDRVLVYDLGSDGGQGGAPAPQKKIAQVREWGM